MSSDRPEMSGERPDLVPGPRLKRPEMSQHLSKSLHIVQILRSPQCFGHIPWFSDFSKFRLIKKFATFVRVKNASSANSVLSPTSVFYSRFREFLRVADKTELSKVYSTLTVG